MAVLNAKKFMVRAVSNQTVGATTGTSQATESTLPCANTVTAQMMVSLAGVLVNQFMQIGAGRHRVEQQNHPHQPGGQGRPAEPNEMTRFVLQTVCNIANGVPLASLI